jgi:hypothetical protein
MTRLRILAAGALLALGACKDSTGPEPEVPDLTVQVTTTTSAPLLMRGVEGEQMVECLITFMATATGDASARGQWTGGVLRYFVGTSAQAVDSLVMPDWEVRQVFGGEFGPGEPREAGLGLRSFVPFSLEIELRYRVTGAQATHKATARTTCGVPTGQPGPAPVVSGFSVVPPAGDLEPGDTVRVTWTAAGSPSLWETGVEVIGSFEAFYPVAGDSRTTVTHTALIVVPDSAKLGEPFHVRAYAVDPWVRVALSTEWTSAAVVDRTPPQVLSLRTTPAMGSDAVSLVGQYATRDSMELHVLMWENHRMAYAVYDFGGARDSLPLSRYGSDLIRIPLRPELAGATQFRVHFTDASGNRTPDFTAAPGAVRVYPVRDAAVTSAPVPEQPHAAVADRGRVYVGLNRLELRVHSLPDLSLVRAVPLPFPVTLLDLTPDGGSLVAAHNQFDRIVVMDVNATAVPAARQLEGVTRVYGIRVAFTGRAIALVRLTDGRTAVLEVDLGTGAQRVIAAGVSVPRVEDGVARSLDRRRMLLGAGCVFDVATEQIGPCRAMGTDFAGTVHGDAAGSYWGRSRDVFDANLQRVLRIEDAPGVLGQVSTIPFTGGGAWAGGQRGLTRVRPDGVVVERLASPPLGELRQSDDGTLLVSWGGGGPAEGGFVIRILDLR